MDYFGDEDQIIEIREEQVMEILGEGVNLITSVLLENV